MKVAKVCVNTWEYESRDVKELSICRELGAEVEVFAKGKITGTREMCHGFSVTRLSSRPLGNRIPNSINRLVSVFTWASFLRKRKDIDVISGHDYIALFIAWFSNVGKRHKAKLVYDSHEFELGRSGNRSAIATWFVCRLERFLMKRCAFSIMVNDEIADAVQQIHHLKQHPVVVRNVPPYWELDDAHTAQVRKEFLSSLGLSEPAFLVLYHGGIMEDRGIEQLIETIPLLPKDVALVVLGNSLSEDYLEHLRVCCRSQGVEERVLFHSAVSYNELCHYVSAADVGVVTVLGTCQSYYFMLPNKFFENIQCLNPVIVSDFPVVGHIVDQYDIGLKVDPTDPKAIAAAILRMRDDKAFYAQCKEHLKQAKEDLCWEKEQETLKQAYRELLQCSQFN